MDREVRGQVPTRREWRARRLRLWARAAALAGAVLFAGGCATEQWVAREVGQAFPPVREGALVRARAAFDRWQTTCEQALSAMEGREDAAKNATARFAECASQSEALRQEVAALGRETDDGIRRTRLAVQEMAAEADSATLSQTSAKVLELIETSAPAWRSRCDAILDQVERLSDKREREASWSKLALLPAERGRACAAPGTVRAGLEGKTEVSQWLASKGAANDPVEDKAVANALANYRSAIGGLKGNEPAGSASGTSFAWNDEKRRLREKGTESGSALQVALVNRAYVLDVLIRRRGRSSYDLAELGYYVAELKWCAQRLGPPWRRELEPLVASYIRNLDSRSAMRPED
jgi:hypothetical protein